MAAEDAATGKVGAMRVAAQCRRIIALVMCVTERKRKDILGVKPRRGTLQWRFASNFVQVVAYASLTTAGNQLSSSSRPRQARRPRATVTIRLNEPELHRYRLKKKVIINVQCEWYVRAM